MTIKAGAAAEGCRTKVSLVPCSTMTTICASEQFGDFHFFAAQMAMNKVPLSPQWRRALEMLAAAGDSGSAEAALIARGFSADMLTSLVRVGLATPTTGLIPRGGQSAPWLRITDAGRRVLGPHCSDSAVRAGIDRPRQQKKPGREGGRDQSTSM